MAVDPTVQYLSIMACVFSALSALFGTSCDTGPYQGLTVLIGVYIVLFVLAIWSTFRQQGKSQIQLRIVTIVLYVIHEFLCRLVLIGSYQLPYIMHTLC